MVDRKGKPTNLTGLDDSDRDLTMFTITNLVLTDEDNMVHMVMNLKRKVVTELMTTYLPTVLLLLITLVTIFFDKDLFGDVIAVNLTIMLVMTTIFTSKIEELPPTSDLKMLDIWLIFCQLVPFTEMVFLTAIDYFKEGVKKQKEMDKETGNDGKQNVILALPRGIVERFSKSVRKPNSVVPQIVTPKLSS